MDATTTSNLPFATIVDDVLGNAGGNTALIKIERLVALIAALQGPTYATRAELYADLSWPAGSVGYVRADANTAFNGVYKKAGSSGVGSWSRVGDLPSGAVELALIDAVSERIQDAIASSTITLTNIDGTANAITADLPAGLGLTTVPVGMPLALRGVGVNTGPVTLSVSGGPALAVLDGRGRQLAAGDLTGGTPLQVRPSGDGPSEYRVISSLTHPADLAQEVATRAALQAASTITLVNLGGTASAITANYPGGLGVTAPANGDRVSLRGVGVNPGAVTLAVNGGTARPVLDGRGRAMVGGEFSGTTPIDLRYSTADGGHWRLVSATTDLRDLLAAEAARKLGQVLRLNNVTGTDEITASLPSAQTVDGLAQDVRVMLSPSGDNVTSDVSLDFGFGRFPIVAPDGGPLLPRDLRLSRPVMLRYSTSSGGQFRVVDGLARLRPAVVVQRATNEINIYLHQTNDDYIHVQVTRVPRPERNWDGWRIDRCRHVVARGQTTYTHVADIWTQGSEVEQVIYLIGAAEGIGGYIHGNEEFTGFSVTLDGAPLTANGWYSGRRVTMTQTSHGYLPGSTTETKWAPKGSHILTNSRTWRISAYPATIEIDNQVTQLAAGHVVNRGYAGMMPMAAANANLASYWPFETEPAVVAGPNIVSDAHRMLIWGPAYWGDVQVIEGWAAADREMRIKLDSSPVGKVYPDAWRGLVSSVGGVWRAVTVLSVGLAGGRSVGQGSPATAGDIAQLRQILGTISNFPEGDPGQVLGFGPEGDLVAVDPVGTDGQSVTITTVTSQAAFDAATPGPLEIVVRIA